MGQSHLQSCLIYSFPLIITIERMTVQVLSAKLFMPRVRLKGPHIRLGSSADLDPIHGGKSKHTAEETEKKVSSFVPFTFFS